jgi:hypothetical protein
MLLGALDLASPDSYKNIRVVVQVEFLIDNQFDGRPSFEISGQIIVFSGARNDAILYRLSDVGVFREIIVLVKYRLMLQRANQQGAKNVTRHSNTARTIWAHGFLGY